MAVTRDDAGNVQVDFVWGNFPLQPDADRGENTLDPTLDNHIIATTGYSNYPQFLPNYAGDDDTGFETVIPDVRGLKLDAAQDVLTAASLDYDVTYATPGINAISTTGKTATLTLDDVYPFVAGDVISGFYNDGDTVSGTFIDAKVKSVDGTSLVLTLKTAIDPALDIATAVGSSLFANWVSGTEVRYVLAMDATVGDIVDNGTVIPLLVIQNND